MQEVESHGLMGTPRVLVGNKCDRGTPESQLATTYAQRLADKYGMPVSTIFYSLSPELYCDDNKQAVADNT